MATFRRTPATAHGRLDGERSAMPSASDSPPGDAPDVSDEDLVRRVRAGDAAAAATLFDRHLPMLRAQARRRLPAALRGKVGASDVIQDAYLAAFMRLGEFQDRGDGSFGAWLRQILEHKVVDEVRRHVEVAKRDARREVRLRTRGDAAEPRADQTSPSGVVARAEEAAAVREAVEDLASDHATVLRLIHREGLSLAEAGLRMNRSADAVRKLHARALASLADRLDRP